MTSLVLLLLAAGTWLLRRWMLRHWEDVEVGEDG